MVIYAYIMPCRKFVGIECQCAIEEHSEANVAVTGKSGVGSTASNVLLAEEVYHSLFIFLLHIDEIKWDVEHACYAPCIIHCIKGATLILYHALDTIVFNHAWF